MVSNLKFIIWQICLLVNNPSVWMSAGHASIAVDKYPNLKFAKNSSNKLIRKSQYFAWKGIVLFF